MALTQDFKQTVSERARRDLAFAQALRDEAQTLNPQGEQEAERRTLLELAGNDPGNSLAEHP
jgi:hypothetical protein